jgi:amidophosphoribosyltransferase
MRKFINAKTLQFLSIEGLYKSMGYEKRNPLYPQYTDHCFTGDYPVEPIDANNQDFDKNKISYMSTKTNN